MILVRYFYFSSRRCSLVVVVLLPIECGNFGLFPPRVMGV